MTDASPTPQEMDDALAAEYALGVLEGAERSATEARIKREPGFAALVSAWEFRLGGMNEDFPDAPAPNLLPAIEARLFPTPVRSQHRPRGLSAVLAWISGAAVAAVLVLAIVAFVAPPRSMLIATLATADNRLAYEVVQFGNTLKVARVAGQTAGVGRVHELWLIAPGKGPVSLGLLGDAPLIIDQPPPPAGWRLAVSLEAEGGSKTGIPTGPEILSVEIGT